VRWNDKNLKIDWPRLGSDLHISDKDALAPLLKDAEHFVWNK